MAHKRSNHESEPEVLVVVNNSFQKAKGYRLYRVVHRLQMYDNNVTSEMQQMRRSFAVQIKNMTFNGKDSVSALTCSNKFRQACDSSPIHKGAIIWLFREFINGRAFATIKTWLTLSSNDANRHRGIVATCTNIESSLIILEDFL